MYPGISKISYFSADNFPDLSLPQLTLPIPSAPAEIELHGNATLSEESAGTAGDKAVSVTLSFMSCQKLPANNILAFIVEDVNGNKYLVGSGPPHCGVLKMTEAINPPGSEPSAFYYTFNIPLPKRKI